MEKDKRVGLRMKERKGERGGGGNPAVGLN